MSGDPIHRSLSDPDAFKGDAWREVECHWSGLNSETVHISWDGYCVGLCGILGLVEISGLRCRGGRGLAKDVSPCFEDETFIGCARPGDRI